MTAEIGRPYVVLTGETKMAQKKCNHCGEWKDEEEFSWRYKSLGVRNKACKVCMGEFNKQYYQGDTYEQHKEDIKERKAVSRETARDFVYQYLLIHPCEMCGEVDPVCTSSEHLGQREQFAKVRFPGSENYTADGCRFCNRLCCKVCFLTWSRFESTSLALPK